MKKRLWQIKLVRYAKLIWRDALSQSLAALTDANARLNYIGLFILILLLVPDRGVERRLGSLISGIEAVEALAYSFPCFLVLNVVWAIFRVPKAELAHGKWIGTRFVYHEPQVLVTALVDSADNATATSFKVDDAELGSTVSYIIEIDRSDQLARAQIVQAHGKPFFVDDIGIVNVRRGKFSLTASREMKLLTFLPSECTLTTIRVHMLNWQVGESDGRGMTRPNV